MSLSIKNMSEYQEFINYLRSIKDDKYKEFLSFYTIHWELIKYAKKNGFTKYNFYGISGDFKDTKDELYGLYDFKRGFGGNVEEYIGEFDLITNKFMYLLYKYGYGLYRKLKK